MKRFALVLSAVLAAAGLASAQSTAKPGDAQSVTKATPSKNQADSHKVEGVVSSVDIAKKAVTFKNPKGESLTWRAEGNALSSLKTLKAGDAVTIAYSVDSKGSPKAAIDIRPATAPAAALPPAQKSNSAAKVEAPKAQAAAQK